MANRRVDTWIVQMPSLGARNFRVCNLSKFCTKLGLNYGSVMAAVASARRNKQQTVSVWCGPQDAMGVIEIGWSYNSMGSMLEALGIPDMSVPKPKARRSTKTRKPFAPSGILH